MISPAPPKWLRRRLAQLWIERLDNRHRYLLIMKNTIASVLVSSITLIALASAGAADTPANLLAIPGKVLYQNDLAGEVGAPLKVAKGKWEAVEGVLRGSEVAADDHAAVVKLAAPFKDAVFEYEVRFVGDAKSTSLSINDAKDHVCRVSLTPTSVTVQKDDHDHEGPDVAEVFHRLKADLKSGEWHKVRLEMVGSEMVGRCDDFVGFGSHDLIGTQKASFGFTVSGESVEFRNLRVYEAKPNPEWESLKKKLIRKAERGS